MSKQNIRQGRWLLSGAQLIVDHLTSQTLGMVEATKIVVNRLTKTLNTLKNVRLYVVITLT